jgi:uncharacterized protein (UPF0332 family)
VITPNKFLQYAKTIVSNPTAPEEESRSAVSRAYYSLYHEALDTMLTKYSLDLIKNIEKEWKRPLNAKEKYQLNSLDPDFLKRINFHRVLPETLRDLKKPIIANKFLNFRDKRNQADYDLKTNLSGSDANIIVSNIDSFVILVKTL